MPLAPAVLEGSGPVSPEDERRLFEKLRLPNGTWKTTYRHRLGDLDRLLLELLPRDRELELMDVAVSSGISTAEWSAQLAAAGVRHRLLAGDLIVSARLLTWGGRVALLSDAGGREPLLLELGGAAVPLRSERRVVRATRPPLAWLLRRASVAKRQRQVPLIAAEARQAPEIEVVEDDVMVPGRFPGRFDALRAANLLQRSYFDEPTLLRLIANLRDRLREGGLLAICQTVGEENQATVFRRRGDHFERVASLATEVQVADLVLSL